MKLKRRGVLGSFNRFRLMLTLGLAVVLPAAALIYLNFRQLRAFERDKVLEAASIAIFGESGTHRKNINKRQAMTKCEESFPTPTRTPWKKKSNLGSSCQRLRGVAGASAMKKTSCSIRNLD